MSKESREHLSCLMDGEISRETGRFLVRRLGADEELRATWARYHVVRDCLRRDTDLAHPGLSARVREALAGDGPPQRRPRTAAAWLKPLAGAAVAASVAVMAIVLVGPTDPAGQPADSGLGTAPTAQRFVSPQSLGPVPASREASFSAGDDSRMSPYLLRHYQAAGSTAGKGFVTFVPIVITPASRVAAEPEPSEAEAAEQPEKPSQNR